MCKQLTLSEHPDATHVLGEHNIDTHPVRRALVKGILFQEWSANHKSLKPVKGPQHGMKARGWWLSRSQAQNYAYAHYTHHTSIGSDICWVRCDQPHWLAPPSMQQTSRYNHSIDGQDDTYSNHTHPTLRDLHPKLAQSWSYGTPQKCTFETILIEYDRIMHPTFATVNSMNTQVNTYHQREYTRKPRGVMFCAFTWDRTVHANSWVYDHHLLITPDEWRD